ncbi:MAG: hypothetical protein IT166_21470 [Bryobacterales bacterium]|nr:hypothetical protein [Bryobacterales bacterium]
MSTRWERLGQARRGRVQVYLRNAEGLSREQIREFPATTPAGKAAMDVPS